MVQGSRRLMVLCATLAFFGVACGSTSGGGGGGGGLAAADTTGGGSLTGKDASGADATCSAADNSCKGSKLQYCDNGAFATMNCDEAGCLAAGFLGSAGCGAGTDGTSTCLCTACTAADNVCLSAKVAQVCDTATGTVSSTTCASGKSCAGGKCAAPTCTPKCASGACGPGSDGCGGTCSCSAGEQCNNGTCQKPCTSADNACSGDTLHTCGSDGQLHDQVCSTASCVQAGFIGYAKCGANPGEAATCLCQGCSAADEKCVGSTAYACDAASGKLVATACSAGQICKAGACQTTCVTSADCTASQLCVTATGVCKEVDGAQYTLEIKWADIVGNYGDTPDPYVSVFKNGVLVCTAPEIADTYYPFWFATCSSSISLKSTDTLTFSMYDSDAFFNDFIGTVEWTGSSLISLLKAGGYFDGAIGSSGTTIDFTLKPL